MEKQVKQERQEKRKRINPKDLMIPIGLMIAMVAVTFGVLLFLTQAERVTIEEPLYQYVFTTMDSYPDGVSMKENEDGITIDNGVQEYETNGYPFYYSNSQKMVLTADCAWMNTEGDIIGYVEHFSDLTPQGDGFLHDGGDVYIFMEETRIVFNKKAVTVPMFSYAVCLQGESLLICPYGSKAIYEELSNDGATAELVGGVVINLADDTYTRPNGVLNLLFTKPSVFEPVGGDE